MVGAAESAGDDIRTCAGALQGMYSVYDVDGVGRVRQSDEIASWIDHELIGLRRRLEMARAINRSTPGVGNFVQFDESAISQRTMAQVQQDAEDAAQALHDGDLEGLNAFLRDGATDPYFAAAFARLVTPRQLGDFISSQSSAGELVPGVDPQEYELALSGLGQTLGLATRGTHDLALPSSWSENFIQAMVSPPYPVATEDSDEGNRFSQDMANRSGLWQIFSRGVWSTPLLQDATHAFYDFDKEHGRGAWRWVLPAGMEYPVGPDGKPMTDAMVALMGALSRNSDAAHWAFTQGSTTDVPLDGHQAPINSFLHYMLAEHGWIGDDDERVGPASVVNTMGVGVQGDKTSPIALDAKMLSESMEE